MARRFGRSRFNSFRGSRESYEYPTKNFGEPCSYQDNISCRKYESKTRSNYYKDKRRNRLEDFNQWNCDGTNNTTKRSESHFSGRSRNKHPPGLKGREIGLWYAAQSRSRNNKDFDTAPSLSMGNETVETLNEALNKLKYINRIRPPSANFSILHSRNTLENSSQNNVATCFESPLFQSKDVKKEGKADLSGSRIYQTHNENSILNSDHCKSDFRKVSLLKNAALDLQYYEELNQNMLSPGYKQMLKVRNKLPSYNMREEILNTISRNQVVLLSGETGCGKTTQVGQFILDDFILNKNGSSCRIICTQPRRISTLAVSQRVAEERNEKLGVSVGYQIRLESVIPRPSASILFCTTGIVLQWLISDPSLSNVSHIILDEIHERDTICDFLMCVIKDVMKLRPDLKIILMSATLNEDQFSKYFFNCPKIHVPGFTYKVQEYYLEDVLKLTSFRYETQRKPRKWLERESKNKIEEFHHVIDPYIRTLEENETFSSSVLRELSRPESEELNLLLIVELLRYISLQPPGAVLIFLPGWESISKLNTLLENVFFDFSKDGFLVLPLHSMMPTFNQHKIFDTPPKGKRKIVIATNIAETSITINDIVYVIDCGKIKMKNYDKTSHVNTLDSQWVTISNAKQRRGRAGRVQEGICFHLYSRARENALRPFPLPEIQRTRLEEVILQIKILKLGSCKTFLSNLMDAPDESIIDASLKLLVTINALDANENLTPLGKHLARMSMDPLIGKMLLMSTIFSCVDPILTVAAALSFKDPFIITMGQEKNVALIRKQHSDDLQSDHLMFANVFNRWQQAEMSNNGRQFTRKNFLSHSVLTQMKNMRNQLVGRLYEGNFINTRDPRDVSINFNANNANLVKAVITAGLYPNVARIMKKNQGRNRETFSCLRLPTNRKAYFHLKSVNDKQLYFDSDWVVYCEKMITSKMFLFDSTVVSPLPLLLFGQHFNYDEKKGVVHVDDFVQCSCSKEVASVMGKLRIMLNELLEYRIANPRMTNWSNFTKENHFLDIVIKTLNE